MAFNHETRLCNNAPREAEGVAAKDSRYLRFAQAVTGPA
jgi:hypothetical protein